MLKINPDPTFEADVSITVPGWKEPGTVSLTFKYRGQREYLEWYASLAEKKDADGKVIQKAKTTSEAFPDFVTAWKGMDAELNSENIATFLNNYPSAYADIFDQYSRLLFESRVKN